MEVGTKEKLSFHIDSIMTIYSLVFPPLNSVVKLFSLTICFFVLFSCNYEKNQTKKSEEKFNVLFIIADDLNCAIGALGDTMAQTPNIDRLASNGFLFENAHNQYPLCGPSRASLMTGMYSEQTQITGNNIFLRNSVPDAITIGQRFRQNGYQSVRIGKIFHYDNPSAIGTSGNDDIHSWDQTINPYGRDKLDEYLINTLSPRRFGGTLSWLSCDGEDTEQTDGIGTTNAIEQLDQFAKNKTNFFLAVGFFRPHTPFVAPHKYFNLFDQNTMIIPKTSDEYLTTLPKPAAKSIRAKKNQLNLNDSLAKEIKEAYYATVSFVDAQVGRILDHLDRTGLAQNTIVVFTSDHGYHLGEHGHWQKQTLFDNATKVPLIFTYPGIQKKGVKCEAPVELIDVYPTIMDLVNINVPKHVVGKSLKPIIDNEIESVRSSALTRWKNGYSIKTKRYRFTEWKFDGKLGHELYDHKYDKEELNNLALSENYKPIFDSLQRMLRKRIEKAQLIPEDIGRQLKDVTPIPKAPNITYGDLYNEDGKLISRKK
ncbi:MAG: sulfatase [Bacteroidota bacterium]|nr:sulfatase [Bacteroidota bacterium]